MFYKYMKAEHAKMFFHNGKIRIGTLLDFKKNENFNSAVGDKNEGSHFPNLPIIGTLTYENLSSKDAYFLNGIIKMSPGSSMSGITIEREIQSNDYYMYCLATKPSREAMQAFECDTCIEIGNISAFLDAITRKIRGKANLLEWKGKVTYLDKRYHHSQETGLNPAITKDLKYSYQNEYRALWKPKDGLEKNLKPFFINAPKAIRLCRIIKI